MMTRSADNRADIKTAVFPSERLEDARRIPAVAREETAVPIGSAR